jgi:hypothetical protein
MKRWRDERLWDEAGLALAGQIIAMGGSEVGAGMKHWRVWGEVGRGGSGPGLALAEQSIAMGGIVAKHWSLWGTQSH